MEALLRQNKNNLIGLFQSVNRHKINLGSLNTWWDKVALIGKINSLNVPQSLLMNMLETKAEFAELQATLIENLLAEQLEQQHRRNKAIAQVIVDIPNRNLFERTADVGFLATDADLIAFLSKSSYSDTEQQDMHARLQAYAAKYSVYDDILLIDIKGQVKAQLDMLHPVKNTDDPVIAEVFQGKQDYYEICRYSCLRPNKSLSSLFLAPVRAAERDGGGILGLLCLSFKLEDEMVVLFNDLGSSSESVFALLDNAGRVLISSQPERLSKDTLLTLHDETQMLTLNHHRYLVTRAKTRGYQGYMGLGWQGCVLLPLVPVSEKREVQPATEKAGERWKGFSPSLKGIQRRSKIVTDDLNLVVLNGRIAAARSDADEFIPILEEIRNIGRQMQSIFSDSVEQLMSTALSTHFNDLRFDAALAIDIMDRNLYERANDCRWWALTTKFIELLPTALRSEPSQQTLSAILKYINGLYTVYTCIYLYDEQGRIVAASTTDFNKHIGQTADVTSNWQGVKNILSPQQYCVSQFVPGTYYHGQHTYVYNAAVQHQGTLLGGIGLIFDSAPQFRDMLNDVVTGSKGKRIAAYVERSGKVIGVSKGAPWKVGDALSLPASVTGQPNGAQGAGLFELAGKEYTLGYAVSKGYREYKVSDDYKNDVIAIVAEVNVGD
ncbi:hypothetical protein [Alteromonas sp. AMM-1]|uniref:hypothetical protein n=1 Tax=Alteromonas sp. AMM-1 TaxID=3394233 RepID=UPI0039A52555